MPDAALTKLETDWWIELENTYKSRVQQRWEIHERVGTAVLDALPGSEMACKELMEMVLSFMCQRYPHHFSLHPNPASSSSKSSDDAPTIFRNDILDSETDLKATPPLIVLLRNVPEDFAIMLRNPQDGGYYMRAGVICSALGWNVASKIGKRLHQIHEPVPDYKQKMKFSMDR